MNKRLTVQVLTVSLTLTATALVSPILAPPAAHNYCFSGYEWPGSILRGRPNNTIPAGWYDSLKESMNAWNGIGQANWTLTFTGSSYLRWGQ